MILYDDINKAVLDWQLTHKRPQGQPRKRWLDVVEDHPIMEVQEWRAVDQAQNKRTFFILRYRIQ